MPAYQAPPPEREPDPLDAMRTRLYHDTVKLRGAYPEGTMWRAWGEAGVALRRLGIELIAASPIPSIYRWLTRHRSEDA